METAISRGPEDVGEQVVVLRDCVGTEWQSQSVFNASAVYSPGKLIFPTSPLWAPCSPMKPGPLPLCPAGPGSPAPPAVCAGPCESKQLMWSRLQNEGARGNLATGLSSARKNLVKWMAVLLERTRSCRCVPSAVEAMRVRIHCPLRAAEANFLPEVLAFGRRKRRNVLHWVVF